MLVKKIKAINSFLKKILLELWLKMSQTNIKESKIKESMYAFSTISI